MCSLFSDLRVVLCPLLVLPWQDLVSQQVSQQVSLPVSPLPVSLQVVLLSPACASLDMFADYAARGRAFATAVEALR